MSAHAIRADLALDCKGLSCPMPIVRTKKAMDQISSGQVIEVQATDRGSLADIQGWAQTTGHQYLGTVNEGEVLKHYLRKASPDELKEEVRFPNKMTNEELLKKLEAQEPLTVLDVREPAEYAFSHIPGAISIPLGELENRIQELNPDQPIHVVCRTGARSDMACQLLAGQGFEEVFNIVPGMSGWTGSTDKLS
ncbi:sulfurtransferase TusA family protein [Paenibacillus sp. J2TS4]|uniref:sulfurtransferase TusA family protein n=1 Tax=Paenibacillus sp. J2TS4 TaxID=2807194 RepID=UPI001AFE37FE|nr:sulfurtransferase TusA family protein [Paenibacillus sp. J2TS4]GIP34914.1 hypothetical protein J2TS4_41240 [Paenibacillus sp. J2TS4]